MLLVITLFFVVGMTHEEDYKTFVAAVSAENLSEKIFCWMDEGGNYFLLLPGYADLSEIQIYTVYDIPVYIDSKIIIDGMLCDAFQLNTAYSLSYTAWGRTHETTITFLQSGNVPTLYIDTESGSMEYIHAEKGNEEAGEMRLYAADGSLEWSGALASINGRGNHTWDAFEKKPYSLTLAEEADLLGMGQAQRWVLLANAEDPSNIRNQIAFGFAEAVGLAYSPSSQWVDVYLNGEYAGLYLLCERNEVHPERVDIDSAAGYLVSLERKDRLEAQGYPYVVTDSAQALRVHYPRETTKGILENIREVFQTAEDAILSEGSDADMDVWQEKIDLDSWVKKYLVEEIFMSCDACLISQYFYVEDGIIYAGPVWDCDISMGETSLWQFTHPNALYANRLYATDGQNSPWFHALYQKEEFYDRMVEIYRTEFLPHLTELIDSKIDEYAEEIRQAALMNQIRWGTEDALQEAAYIKQYMTERIAFLNSVWIDGVEYVQVAANPGNGGFYAYYSILPGECLYDLPTLPDNEFQTFLGWYHADTGEMFDENEPICEDLELVARWQDTPGKRVGQIVKLIPLAVLVGLFACIFVADIRRMKRGG